MNISTLLVKKLFSTCLGYLLVECQASYLVGSSLNSPGKIEGNNTIFYDDICLPFYLSFIFWSENWTCARGYVPHSVLRRWVARLICGFFYINLENCASQLENRIAPLLGLRRRTASFSQISNSSSKERARFGLTMKKNWNCRCKLKCENKKI